MENGKWKIKDIRHFPFSAFRSPLFTYYPGEITYVLPPFSPALRRMYYPLLSLPALRMPSLPLSKRTVLPLRMPPLPMPRALPALRVFPLPLPDALLPALYVPAVPLRRFVLPALRLPPLPVLPRLREFPLPLPL